MKNNLFDIRFVKCIDRTYSTKSLMLHNLHFITNNHLIQSNSMWVKISISMPSFEE